MVGARDAARTVTLRGRTVLAAAWAATVACEPVARGAAPPVTLRFWAFGHEGEVVQALMPAFERAHPGIRVRVEQIPFTVAHAKLLTAVVGNVPPDVGQLGNTWLPELATLHALVPLDTLIGRSEVISPRDYFPGIWATNVLADTTFGVPWYVDTRVVFYRSDLLAAAGYARPPTTWSAWYDAMRRLRAQGGVGRYAVLLPVNEWAQPVILAMAAGAPLLRDSNQYGDFTESRFTAAFTLYVHFFDDSLAPPVSNTQVLNLYQSFARGDFAMFISGPWDVGECLRRLPPALRGHWMTTPMPAPDPVPAVPATTLLPPAGDTAQGTSLAGGSSLVVFRGSQHQREAWALIEYLSAPEQQATFYRLAEDLPARRSAWSDSAIAGNPYMTAFARQLRTVRPTPQVPEWDQITDLITSYGERAVRGVTTPTAALAELNRDVDGVLAKRRWVMAHDPASVGR
jgi:multiple sugar transport system substrate-binding protein